MSILADLQRELRTLKLLLRAQLRIGRYRIDGSDTAADLIEAQVDRQPRAVAIEFEGRSWSYAELDRAANRVARWANERGLGRGKVVALLMENRPEFLFTWIGLAKAGAATALINTNLTGTALAHALKVSDAAAVVVGAELAEQFESARGELDESLDLWVQGGALAGAEDMDAALAAAAETRPPRSWREGLAPSEVLFLIYTSGTTGLPKAARMSHYRFVQAGSAFSALADVTADDVVYCVLPLYHTAGGVLAVSLALLNGATLVLRRKFSTSAFWEDCRSHGVTVFQYIGELCRYLANRPPSADDRTHRVRCAVGNGLRPDVWTTFQERFGISNVIEFYGATEGNFALINIDNKPGAVGRVPSYLKRFFPVELIRYDVETEWHPRDPSARCIRCAPGEASEAIGRISNNPKDPMGHFEGYTDKQASEKKILRDVFATGDAWYRTGDLLSRDESGYYYFVDRIGDTFRWKGENVATSEVAEILSVYDGIAEANVYGVRVPGADGRAGMAALVCNDALDLEGLYKYVTGALPAYAQPLFLRLRESMETTGTFKHRKVDLVRDGFDPTAIADPVYFRSDDARRYVPLDATLYQRIAGGNLRL